MKTKRIVANLVVVAGIVLASEALSYATGLTTGWWLGWSALVWWMMS